MQNKETTPRLNLETHKTSDITLSPSEQEAVFFGLTTFIINHTNLEVIGDLTPAALEELSELREVYCRLSDALGKSERLGPGEWLSLGISNRVEKKRLEKWADDNNDVLFQQRAEYFLKKQEKTE